YEWAFEHKPGFAIAHLNLGNVHLKLGTAYEDKGHCEDAINAFRRAIREFRSAIHIDPEPGLAHFNLGNVLVKLDDVRGGTDKTAAGCEYLEAIVKSRQAVVSNPRSAAAHQLLGTALKNKEWVETTLKNKNTGMVETANCISSGVSPK